MVTAADAFLATLSADQTAESVLDLTNETAADDVLNATQSSGSGGGGAGGGGAGGGGGYSSGTYFLAFLGHSVTLAVAALARLDLPAAPVESLIAASILIGAGHALRPLFPGREALIAAGFGLIHGMAFSFTLAELHLDTGQLVLSLLGFNLASRRCS